MFVILVNISFHQFFNINLLTRLLSQCAWAGLYLNVKNHLTIPSCTTQYPVEILPQPPLYEDYVPGLKSTGQVNSDDVFATLKTESGALMIFFLDLVRVPVGMDQKKTIKLVLTLMIY